MDGHPCLTCPMTIFMATPMAENHCHILNHLSRK
ncbi:hypothetical protein GXY_13428 [Novacetimonas hansenii ATCC 23769]|uniref:Uncharacterized protein n=1 Tax=Novacetimonas hansenii ATCC 23769 TaxID=714995 RepID=D5QHQ7_NOVHA|nr:hypothetical protein GXY_13428 [Novacetimonas hansenii ATCC 23769]